MACTLNSAQAALLKQRSTGGINSIIGQSGFIRHREEGCLKLRMPKGSREAILLNTSGGLAGGDEHAINLEIAEGGDCFVSGQAAERVYGTLGPAACISCTFRVGANARFHWVPQETIVFNGAALHRTIEVSLARSARFLGVESFVLGRTESAEDISHISIRDTWEIMRDDKVLHVERLQLGPELRTTSATLGAARAFATVLLVSDDAETIATILKEGFSDHCAVSCWNGKLVARVLAKDGFELRKVLKTVLSACLGGSALPRVWTM
jgi:urease accessory protein